MGTGSFRPESCSPPESFRPGSFCPDLNNQNIDNSECFGVKLVKIYPELTLQ